MTKIMCLSKPLYLALSKIGVSSQGGIHVIIEIQKGRMVQKIKSNEN